MFPQKSFRLSGQGVGVQRRSFRGSGIVRLVFQRAHGVAPRESEALQGCCLGKRAPNARECAIQQQESPAVRQTIVKHTKETIEGVLPVTKYLSSQGKEIGRKGDSFFQKIGVILEQYFMSMLDEDTDRQAIAKVVQKERSYLSSFAGLFPASLAGARGLCEKRHRWRRLEKFGYFPEFLKNKSQSEKGAKRNLATCFEATHAGKRNAGSFRQFRLGNIQKQPAFPCPFCKLHLYVMGCLKCRMYVHLISKVLI